MHVYIVYAYVFSFVYTSARVQLYNTIIEIEIDVLVGICGHITLREDNLMVHSSSQLNKKPGHNWA